MKQVNTVAICGGVASSSIVDLSRLYLSSVRIHLPHLSLTSGPLLARLTFTCGSWIRFCSPSSNAHAKIPHERASPRTPKACPEDFVRENITSKAAGQR